jgi:hypothetical protein
MFGRGIARSPRRAWVILVTAFPGAACASDPDMRASVYICKHVGKRLRESDEVCGMTYPPDVRRFHTHHA